MAAFLYKPFSHSLHFEYTTTIYENKNTSTFNQFVWGPFVQTALQTDTIPFLITQKPLAIIQWATYKFYKTP